MWTASEYCFVVIWGECNSLAGFDVASMDGARIVYVPSGSVLNITEMYYDGAPADKVDQDCTDVEWI